jgi:hypothetical protein
MFGGDVPMGGVADELVADVAEYGKPYAERHGSLAAIMESMAFRRRLDVSQEG